MSSINLILSASNTPPINHGATPHCSNKSGEHASPFGALMEHALVAAQSESSEETESYGDTVDGSTKSPKTADTDGTPTEASASSAVVAFVMPVITVTGDARVETLPVVVMSETEGEATVSSIQGGEESQEGKALCMQRWPQVSQHAPRVEISNASRLIVDPAAVPGTPAKQVADGLHSSIEQGSSDTPLTPSDDASQQIQPPSLQPVAKASPGAEVPLSFDDATLSNMAAKTSPKAEIQPAGISSAQQEVAMKKGEEIHKTAVPAEKDLPGNTVTLDRENLPVRQEHPSPVPARSDRVETIATAVVERVAKVDDASASAISPSVPNLSVRAVERTHDMIALHAMRLRDSASDSLQVVIKPGAGLQLSLELRQKDGGIEAQAILQRGDFDHLNRNWAELQHRLESRGVRLAALTCSENFHNGGQSSFQQRHRPSGDSDPAVTGAFAEFAFAGSMTEAVSQRAPRTKLHHGWETWA